eukprot:TRINITY_DN2396_c0_g1_i1.p1 TRINITY_DN2396_c0_g1~~TRINITY_DN2396_c0_g1_i1.p1  ORF type:complete len:144 (+),score=17.29 TRINITY_DN2396_c0_g1_i1:83-514(+)
MNSPVYVLAKAGGLFHNHVTLVIECSDGFYEFGFYGLGFGQSKSVSVDKYSHLPNHRVEYNVGTCRKSLSNVIKKARSWKGYSYNLSSRNCGHFVQMLCAFVGVSYPRNAVLRNHHMESYNRLKRQGFSKEEAMRISFQNWIQ